MRDSTRSTITAAYISQAGDGDLSNLRIYGDTSDDAPDRIVISNSLL